MYIMLYLVHIGTFVVRSSNDVILNLICTRAEQGILQDFQPLPSVWNTLSTYRDYFPTPSFVEKGERLVKLNALHERYYHRGKGTNYVT